MSCNFGNVSWRWTALLGLLGSMLGACRAERRDEWVRISRDDLVLSVEVEGTLAPVNADTLGPPRIVDLWEYKIASMVAEGGAVSKGDVVLQFDTSQLEQQLVSKQNERDSAKVELERERSDEVLSSRQDGLDLAEAEAKLRKAELKVERPSDLLSSLELSLLQLDLELARKEVAFRREKAAQTRRQDAADVAALEAAFAKANERVRQIEADIPKMALVAPRDGTLIYVLGQNRTKKKVGDGVWWGENLLQTAALDQMTARGEIDEVDIRRVSVGQSVSLKLESHPDTEYAGKVQAIGSIVEPKSQADPLRVVRLEIELASSDARAMRPGMRFRGRIEIERCPGVLLLPIDAVTLGDHGPEARVLTAAGVKTSVLRLGRRNQTQVEVLAGAGEGDRVLLSSPAISESEGI